MEVQECITNHLFSIRMYKHQQQTEKLLQLKKKKTQAGILGGF